VRSRTESKEQVARWPAANPTKRHSREKEREPITPKKVKQYQHQQAPRLPWPTSTAGSGLWRAASFYVAWLSEHVRASRDSIQTALRATQFGVSLRRTPLTPQHNRRGPGVELALDPAGSGFTTHSRVRKMLASKFAGMAAQHLGHAAGRAAWHVSSARAGR
jgi:hypothetical protein